MLELIGSVADGWVPTLEYLPRGVDSLPELNARIDEAAHAAGRSPTDVRRLLNVMNVQFSTSNRGVLNGPPQQWVDQLTDLALTHGVTAVLIGGDDSATTERFAAEVAPAVRELVARERG
jgi:alkanesulfonate monooxygenase SsuD/methylene tetrahydromethanopterin reductase-like flavin-dependent oxidoreductase (luciferase family)